MKKFRMIGDFEFIETYVKWSFSNPGAPPLIGFPALSNPSIQTLTLPTGS